MPLEIVRPRIYSYQGASWSLPPNTVEAFEEALQQGAEGLAIDVSETGDGILIAGNDRLIRALALGPRRVDQVDWATLRSLDLAQVFGGPSRMHVSRLKDVLGTFVARVPLILRVSRRRTCERIKESLQTSKHALENLALMSGNLRTLESLKLPIRRYFAPSSSTVRRSEHIDGLAWPTLGLSSMPVPDEQLRHFRVVGLDCDSGASATLAFDFGCDIVLTERPAWLHQRFASLSPRRGRSDRKGPPQPRSA